MAELRYPAITAYFPPEDREAILKAIDQILRTGQLTQGPYLKEFEAACAQMAGTRYALAINSGGTALELTFQALNLAGGEVIVPTDTFVASANSVIRAGGTPVFADIDPATLALSVKTIQNVVTPRTKAILLVHMFGVMSPEIPAIQAFCRERKILLIEDAAHAHGGSIGTQKAGALGAAGCFSYYATKVLTTGEGGLVTTSDERLYQQIKSLRDHGRAADGVTFDKVGNNFRLPEIACLLGIFQQKRLPEILAHRRLLATRYRAALSGSNALTLVDPAPYDGHAYWRYPVLLARGTDRQKVQAVMAAQHQTRITWMYEPLCHEQPVFKTLKMNAGQFPVASDIMQRLINLPAHMGIQPDDVPTIAQSLIATLGAGAPTHA